MDNCIFTKYSGKSVVCILGIPEYGELVPLYVMHHNVSIIGTMHFDNNQAMNGGAILMSNGCLKFDGKSNVTFVKNTANKGSAIYINNNASVVFEGKCMIKNKNNYAYDNGALYSNYSTIMFTGGSEVNFINNDAIKGGAVYLSGQSIFMCKGKCKILFNDNAANDGGAMYHSITIELLFKVGLYIYVITLISDF